MNEAWFDDVERLAQAIVQAHRRDCGIDDIQFKRLERANLSIHEELQQWHRLQLSCAHGLGGITSWQSRQSVWMREASAALQNFGGYREALPRVTASVLGAAATIGLLVDDAKRALSGGPAEWGLIDPIVPDEVRQECDRLFKGRDVTTAYDDSAALRIAEAVRIASEPFAGSRHLRARTAAILEAISQLGNERHYMVKRSGGKDEEGRGGWLFDAVWMKADSESPLEWRHEFQGLALAAEVELGRGMDRMLYDFLKLTVVRADLKVLVMWARNFGERVRVACEKCPAGSGHYLVLGIPRTRSETFQTADWKT